ncbi:MAG: ATP-dependent DNA helicase [Candidatus Magasanikiibacteriota bacterium]
MYNLNQQQKQAIEHTSGPLLIVAGAGTGKTTVITQKIAYLVEQKLAKPENILALTFTEKAAGEMVERVDDILDIGYTDLQISTFHAFCQKILEEYGLEIGLPARFKLMTDTDAWLLVKKHLYDFNLDYYRPLGSPMSMIHSLLNHFSKAKDELVSTTEYLEYVENVKMDKDEANIQEKNRQTELANAYHTYNQLLLDNGYLDFGDLIFYTVKLLKDRPNILKALQERFTYILVDEFQDVNWSQYQLIKLLALNPEQSEGSRSSSDKHRDSSALPQNCQLTVVGDDDQSIYSFRGSNVSVIMHFKEDFKNAKEIVLNENYRSAQEILDLSYKSIQNNNPDRLEVKLKIDKKLHNPERSEGSRGSSNKQRDSSSSSTPQNNVIEHIHCQTLDDEVQAVIKKISEIKSKSVESMSWDDFAILVRANSHVEPFIQALEQASIPYEYLASSGLYRQPIVLNCLAFFQLLTHVYDDRAMYRLLRMPAWAIDENDMQKITARAKQKSISYYEVLKRGSEFDISTGGQKIASKILETIHSGMKQARYDRPTAVLYNFLENSDYLTYLTHGENNGDREIIRQINYLRQLLDLIKTFEQITPDCKVLEFVEHFNNIIDSGDGGKIYQPEDTPDSVNIITVHGAKGLEYKYVFVVNLVEERFPTRKKGGNLELPDELVKDNLPNSDFHYEEERRLFYVACTRAKEKLFLTSAEDYGGTRKKKISRFLTELSEALPLQGGVGGGLDKKQILDLKMTSPKPPLVGEELIYETPNKFSFSQISSYERCPYQYKLAHVLKIPMKGSASFSFGNTIHNTLQDFYTKIQELNSVKQASLFGLPVETKPDTGEIKVPSQDELLQMYEKNWAPDWYNSREQREKYFAKGKEILKIFYSSQQNNWTIPVSLEGWFKVKVGDYIVHGRIDRIDKVADGSLEIIDYKTGKAKETLTTEDKQQLLIYQIAAQTLPEYRNIGPVGQLTFYYVNDNLKTSFIGEDKDLEKLQEKILKTINQIKTNNFIATPNKHVCQYCDFKEICEFRIL